MRRYVLHFAMLTLAVLSPGALRGDDQQIAAQIMQKLQAEKQAGNLKGFSIDMQVDEGTVWLSGRVATAAQQSKALDIARRIPGVVQVVNDLEVTAPPAATAKAEPASTAAKAATSVAAVKTFEEAPAAPTPPAAPAVTIKATEIPATPIASNSPANKPSSSSGVQHPEAAEKATAVKPAVAADSFYGGGAVGSGVTEASASANTSNLPGFVQQAQPVANMPQALPAAASAQPIAAAPAPQFAAAPAPQFAGGQAYAMIPVYAGSQSQVPLAFAPARPVNYQGAEEGVPGSPTPMYMPGSGVGIAPARYDHPQMPGYAWPSYASHPNYAAVTYPKQYSPTAWPYIGPFYPYPQVPLGWRKVTLEWDDGWWVLDFKDRRTMYNHH